MPAGTPNPVITRLDQEIVKAFAQPEFHEKISVQGGDAETGSPAQFAAYIRAEIKKWAQVIKASGAQAE